MDNEKKEVLEVYTKTIGELNEVIEKEVGDAITKFSAPWVTDAIREAVIHNKPTWAYVLGILGNWRKKGKHTDNQPSSKIDPDKYIKGRYGHLMHR